MSDNTINDGNNNTFSDYPEEINRYFRDNEVIIKVIPNELDDSCRMSSVDIPISTADQYNDYLTYELDFWNKNDPQKKLRDIVHVSNLQNAAQNFYSAIDTYNKSNTNQSSINSSLQQSIKQLSSGTLYSKTTLASFILQYKDCSSKFISGLKDGLLKNSTTNGSRSVDEIDGITTALNFKHSVQPIYQVIPQEIESLQNTISDAKKEFAELSSKYTKSFDQQKKDLNDFKNQTIENLNEIDEKSVKQFEDAGQRMIELETTYSELLKLKEPAKYWDEMENDYKVSGKHWLIGSMVFLSAIVVLVAIAFCQIPDILSEDTNWLTVFKSTALITVITSILIYVLRLFIKMTISSFHLARDAKERNKLTFFYLALIEKNAVTDKERAIILNSLFSRSDTGLLKGDSSPAMSGNVTDLANNLSKFKE